MRPVLSSKDWLIEETAFDFEEANFKETIFTVGNGYQGTRGSLEEGHKGELSGTYLSGVYDHHDSTVIDQVNGLVARLKPFYQRLAEAGLYPPVPKLVEKP